MVINCQSICIKCGKQRVVVKTKKERLNSSWVYTTITACPDSECQKLVDAMLNKEKAVRSKIIENQEREKVLRDNRRRRSHRRKVVAVQTKK